MGDVNSLVVSAELALPWWDCAHSHVLLLRILHASSQNGISFEVGQ